MYFRDTEIMRAERMVENLGYVPGARHDGPDFSFVTFYDPHTLHPDWTAPIIAGQVRFTSQEILELRQAPDAKARIFARVREAIAALSDNLQNPSLKGVGLSLSFTLLGVYPLLGRMF